MGHTVSDHNKEVRLYTTVLCGELPSLAAVYLLRLLAALAVRNLVHLPYILALFRDVLITHAHDIVVHGALRNISEVRKVFLQMIQNLSARQKWSLADIGHDKLPVTVKLAGIPFRLMAEKLIKLALAHLLIAAHCCAVDTEK